MPDDYVSVMTAKRNNIQYLIVNRKLVLKEGEMRYMSKILVVDDEVKACEFLKRFLETRGYDVIVSYSGEDALGKVENLKPDIMLLDIRMPGMDGMEVLRRVREFDRDVGIVMTTAVKDVEVGKEALKIGADEYIIKPINLDYLDRNILVDLIMRNK